MLRLPPSTANQIRAAAADLSNAAAQAALGYLNIKSSLYGAVGDAIVLSDAAMTSGSAVVTSASNPFTAAMVGRVAYVAGAGEAGADLITTVAAYSSAGSITLSATAGTTVSGAEGVVGTDDTAAIQSALDAAVDGGEVYIPSGRYLVAAGGLTCAKKLKIIGSGRAGPYGSASSLITTLTKAEVALTVSAVGCTLEDWGIDNRRREVQTTSIGILFTEGRGAAVNRVSIQNFAEGLKFTNSTYCSISSCYIFDCTEAGIEFANTTNGDFGDQRVWANLICGMRYSNADGTGRTFKKAVVWRSGGGFYFWGNKINGNQPLGNLPLWQYGVHAILADGVSTSQFYVQNNSIEGTPSYPIYIEQTGVANTGTLVMVDISGNELYSESQYCIVISPQAADKIGRINIGGNIMGGANGIICRRVYDVNITSNTIFLTGNGNPVFIDTGCRNYRVEPQIVSGSVVRYQDADANWLASNSAQMRNGPLEFVRTVTAVTSSTAVTQWQITAVDQYSSALVELSFTANVGTVGPGVHRSLWAVTRGSGGDATATSVGTNITSGASITVTAVTSGLGGRVRFKAALPVGVAFYGVTKLKIDGPVQQVRTNEA